MYNKPCKYIISILRNCVSCKEWSVNNMIIIEDLILLNIKKEWGGGEEGKSFVVTIKKLFSVIYSESLIPFPRLIGASGSTGSSAVF